MTVEIIQLQNSEGQTKLINGLFSVITFDSQALIRTDSGNEYYISERQLKEIFKDKLIRIGEITDVIDDKFKLMFY